MEAMSTARRAPILSPAFQGGVASANGSTLTRGRLSLFFSPDEDVGRAERILAEKDFSAGRDRDGNSLGRVIDGDQESVAPFQVEAGRIILDRDPRLIFFALEIE
jgi:hypothetical protein